MRKSLWLKFQPGVILYEFSGLCITILTQRQQHLPPVEVAAGTYCSSVCLLDTSSVLYVCAAQMTLQWIISKEIRSDFTFCTLSFVRTELYKSSLLCM